MRLVLAPDAAKQYQELEPKLQALMDKQLKLLLNNLRHPSLKAKKYDEARAIWQGRVNRDYRSYFRIRDDVYDILAITKHPKQAPAPPSDTGRSAEPSLSGPGFFPTIADGRSRCRMSPQGPARSPRTRPST